MDAATLLKLGHEMVEWVAAYREGFTGAVVAVLRP